MKVLHIGKYFFPETGGIERYMQCLCPGLAEHVDLDVIVFSRDKEEVTEEFGFRLHRVKADAVISRAPMSFKLIRKIASIPADIVHLHHPNPMALLAYLLSNHKGRLVVSYHGDLVRSQKLGALASPILERLIGALASPMHEIAWRRTRRFICGSTAYTSSSPVLSRYAERCSMVPFGIDLRPYENIDQAQINSIKERFPGKIVLCVGRLMPSKGYSYLIKAIDKMRSDGCAPNVLLIGNGPLLTSLKEMVNELQLEDQIHFLGEINDLEKLLPYYAAADIFALPSISETYAIVQVEAMACGTPVVNTNLPTGVPFVSPDGVTGLTVPPKDPDALAQALFTLLNNEDLRQQFATAARKRAFEEFSSEKMIARTLAVYKEVMEE